MELFEIKRLICELIIAQDPTILTIQDDEMLYDRGIDSLRIIELVVHIEEKFGFEFEMDKLTYETLRTVSSISEYVHQRVKENTK